MNKKILMLTCASVLLLGANGAWAADEGPVVASVVSPQAVEKTAETGGLTGVEPQAMEKVSRADMHKVRAERFANELGLSEEQRKKAEEIRKADFEKMKPLMEEMKALHEKMDAMRQENMKSFEAILTPEQQATFKQMIEEHKNKMGERGPRHIGGFPGIERPAPEKILHK